MGRVVGIDRRDPPSASSGHSLEFYRMDIRSPDLERVLRGVSVVVHLAATFAGEDAEVRDINVGGTRLVIEAAVDAGVGKLVLASSTLAYGAHPDNDFPLTEASPLRPVAELPHSAHRAEAEEILRAARATNPGLRTVILRLAPVLGPSLSGTAARVVESPFAFAVRGYDVPVQAVHEDDAARALLVAAMTDLEGVYNVCAPDWIDPSDAADALGQRRIELDAGHAGQVTGRFARSRAGIANAYLPFLMYPWVASSEALTATGFTFEHGTLDALSDAARAREGWIAVGDMRFRPKRLALVGGAIAALALGGAVRRRSRRS